jgi:hypothetical protein
MRFSAYIQRGSQILAQTVLAKIPQLFKSSQARQHGNKVNTIRIPTLLILL